MTDKQKRFVEEYCKDLNATQSAIRSGYSPKTANVIGKEILDKDYIKEAIQQQIKKRTIENNINADMVLNGIKEIALNQNNKVNDRLKALELLGKYLKLFTDKIENTTIISNTDIKVTFEKEMKDWSK